MSLCCRRCEPDREARRRERGGKALRFGRKRTTPAATVAGDERIVELTRFPTRFAADVAVAALHARGITATVAYGDADGWEPQFSVVQGSRIMVFERDLGVARRVLDSGSD